LVKRFVGCIPRVLEQVNCGRLKIDHLKLERRRVLGSDYFLTGFNPGTQKYDSLGRPVDMVFDKKGN
jgi:hypothetical protein